MIGTVRVGACFDEGDAKVWKERLGVDRSDFISSEWWLQESFEVGGEGDCILKLL